MNKVPRVAVVGAGYFSQFHYNAWKRLTEEGRVELVAACDQLPERVDDVAAKYGITLKYGDPHSMLVEARPDIVDIATPPATHAALVDAALQHEAAVICQKPFTPSLTEARALLARIERSGRLVVVHENFRFQPWYTKIKSMLDEGRLGTLYQLTFRLRPGDGQGADAYLARQPYFQTMPRFLVHETAVHQIDVFRYLAGEVRTVYAQLNRRNMVIAGEDAGIIVFEFDDGVVGVFDGNRLADHAAANRRLTMGELCIEGSAGTLRLNGDAELLFRAHGANDEELIGFDWRDEDFGGDCVYRLQEHVVEHVVHGTPVVNTAREYLSNLDVVGAVYRSAEEGRRLSCG